MNNLKIGIVGLGMVGSPIRKWFKEVHGYKRGRDLFCYDSDPKKGFNEDVNRADVIFVAVPTPSNPDGTCNLSMIDDAVSKIKDGKIVVIKSTVPPGTVESLQNKYPGKRFIFNPEFLTESQAWEDFLYPDRQIIGSTEKSASDAIEVLNILPRKNFIRPWTTDYQKKTVNSTEAEFGKYASNVFGYIKVVYGNILADLCHALDKKLSYGNGKASGKKVDYEKVRELIAADLRVGPSWLNVSHGNYSGAGGYCFPKDMNAFITFAESVQKDLNKKKLLSKEDAKILKSGISVLKAVRDYNETLIEAQGLTMDQVIKHSKDIDTRKVKKIRV